MQIILNERKRNMAKDETHKNGGVKRQQNVKY